MLSHHCFSSRTGCLTSCVASLSLWEGWLIEYADQWLRWVRFGDRRTQQLVSCIACSIHHDSMGLSINGTYSPSKFIAVFGRKTAISCGAHHLWTIPCLLQRVRGQGPDCTAIEPGFATCLKVIDGNGVVPSEVGAPQNMRPAKRRDR